MSSGNNGRSLLSKLAWPVVLCMLALAIALLIKGGNEQNNKPKPTVTQSQSGR